MFAGFSSVVGELSIKVDVMFDAINVLMLLVVVDHIQIIVDENFVMMEYRQNVRNYSMLGFCQDYSIYDRYDKNEMQS